MGEDSSPQLHSLSLDPHCPASSYRPFDRLVMVELLQLIITFTLEVPSEPLRGVMMPLSERQHLLSRLLRVSRLFYSVAFPLLYRTLHLRGSNLVKQNPTLQITHANAWRLRLIELLEACRNGSTSFLKLAEPELIIKELFIPGASILPIGLGNVGVMLKGVKTITCSLFTTPITWDGTCVVDSALVTDRSYLSLPAFDKALLPNLTSLHLVHTGAESLRSAPPIQFRIPRFFLSLLPQLSSLTITSAFMGSSAVPPRLSTLPRLRVLHLGRSGLGSTPEYEVLTARYDALESVWHPWIRSLLPQLDTLVCDSVTFWNLDLPVGGTDKILVDYSIDEILDGPWEIIQRLHHLRLKVQNEWRNQLALSRLLWSIETVLQGWGGITPNRSMTVRSIYVPTLLREHVVGRKRSWGQLDGIDVIGEGDGSGDEVLTSPHFVQKCRRDRDRG